MDDPKPRRPRGKIANTALRVSKFVQLAIVSMALQYCVRSSWTQPRYERARFHWYKGKEHARRMQLHIPRVYAPRPIYPHRGRYWHVDLRCSWSYHAAAQWFAVWHPLRTLQRAKSLSKHIYYIQNDFFFTYYPFLLPFLIGKKKKNR